MTCTQVDHFKQMNEKLKQRLTALEEVCCPALHLHAATGLVHFLHHGGQ